VDIDNGSMVLWLTKNGGGAYNMLLCPLMQNLTEEREKVLYDAYDAQPVTILADHLITE
jgi:hypothetical protein